MLPDIPQDIDRLIIHQFDPSRPSPGGIDTCLRGIARYAPVDATLAFVGVDTGSGPKDRKIGSWEKHIFGDRHIWFLPVAKLDPADQKRRVPHSVRLAYGLLRRWKHLPEAPIVQTHRMDIGSVAKLLFRSKQAYFIHTQDHGLTGKTSDSIWRWFGGLHRRLEMATVRTADQVVVFNPDYASTVREWNPKASFSPTWFDPSLIEQSGKRNPYRLCWVGRLETPKDPLLALAAFDELIKMSPEHPWSIDFLGSGTLHGDLKAAASTLGASASERVTIHGRVDPKKVASTMATSGQFLMTSHAGYEGYPRVLVEAMASGLPSIVTEGSDTGGLVAENRTGFVTSRDPKDIAQRIVQTLDFDRAEIVNSVSSLSAPQVVGRIYS